MQCQNWIDLYVFPSGLKLRLSDVADIHERHLRVNYNLSLATVDTERALESQIQVIIRFPRESRHPWFCRLA